MAKGVITDVIDIKAVSVQIETTLKGLEQIAVKIDEINTKQGKIKGTTGTSGGKAAGSYDAEKAQAMELERELKKLTAQKEKAWQQQEKLNKQAEINKEKQNQKEIEAAMKQRNAESEKMLRNAQKELDYLKKHGEQTVKLTRNVADLKVKLSEAILTYGEHSKQVRDVGKQYDDQRAKLTKLQQRLGDHTQDVGRYGKVWDNVKNSWVGITAAWTAATVAGAGVVRVLKSAVEGAMEDERAQKRLQFALNGSAQATERLLRFKDRMMESTLFSEDEIMATINMGLELGRTENEVKKMTETAMGLSRVTGQDLNTVMLQLSGTYEGQTGRLGKLSSEIKGLSEEQLRNGDAIDILNKKYGQFASEGIASTEGQVLQMKKWWGEALDDVGMMAMDFFNGIKIGFKAITAVMGGGIGERALASQKAQNTKSAQLQAHQEKMDQINAEIENSLKLMGVNLSAEKQKVNEAKTIGEVKKAWDEYVASMIAAEKVKAAIAGGTFVGPVATMAQMGAGGGELSKMGKATQPFQGEGMIGVPNAETSPASPSLDRYTEADLAADAAAWGAKFQIAQEFTQKIDALVTASFSNRFAELDKEAQKDEANKTKELERAKGNKSQIEEINKRYAAKEKERDKERRRLEIEQAKYKKASGIVGAIINTAVAVTGMLANPGGVLGIVLAALTAVTGAAEIAMIASQPIPSYAKGRKGGKAEFANVGEKGVEKIITKSGAEYFTPGTSTLAYLPEGAEVVPHHKLMEQARLAAFGHSDYSGSMYDFQMFQTNTRIEETNRKLDLLADVIKNKREVHMSFDKRGFATSVRNGATWEHYVNNNVRL